MSSSISFMSFFKLSTFLFIFFLKIQKSLEETPKRPNIYRWLAQNSYICDPTLLNRNSHRFLAPRESLRLRCSCGDPLITKSACARKGLKEKPKCFKLPDACLREYSIIFASGGNRNKPHPKPIFRIKKRPIGKINNPKKKAKILGTQPVNTVLRVRKPNI